MAYQRVPRPSNALPDELVWKALGLSRATFFRKLKDGSISSPTLRDGTMRRWWTPADIELAHQELSMSQKGPRTS
jgi:predicted DNA-binding transcriptional regulator AlpA